MKPIRVLLADDHNLFRAGVRTLLENDPGIEVGGEAGTGREALQLIQAQSLPVQIFGAAEVGGQDEFPQQSGDVLPP